MRDTKPMAKAKKGRPPVAQPKKPMASFRGSPEFAEWFEGLVKRERISASHLVERAVVDYAIKVGYEKPAPER